MKKRNRWFVFILLIVFMAQPALASIAADKEVTGRGEEGPVAILADSEGFILAFQEPGRLIRYDNEWTEKELVDLPEGFVPNEMIRVDESIWVLDEKNDIVLQASLASLQIIQSFESEFPYELIGIFEMDGFILLMDEKAYIRQLNEDFTVIGWLSGARVYQAVVYDGYFIYIGGRIQSSGSGVLVKTPENEQEDEWLMSDDPDAWTYSDYVEKIRLLSDGFFYVVYRDTGIARYDPDGLYQSSIYPEKDEVRTFEDIAYHPESGKYYMVDRESGVFEVNWPEAKEVESEVFEIDWTEIDWFNLSDEEWDSIWEQWVDIEDPVVNSTGARLTTRTIKGVTKAQVGEGKLVHFYGSSDTKLRIQLPTRPAERLELKIPTADLIEAQERGIEWLDIKWKEDSYRFSLIEWPLELEEVEDSGEDYLEFDGEVFDDDEDFEYGFDDDIEEEHVGIDAQYVEIQIDQGEIIVDSCVVEWLDEISKLVQRVKLQ